MKKQTLTLIISLFIPILLFGQKPDMKYGKVSKEELEMEYYENDSSANAVVLFDKGYSYFRYENSNNRGFQLVFERQVRIKVFNKEGYNYADFKIPLYVSNNGISEEISAIKGKTYNLEGGKIIKTKLENSNIFYEKTNPNLKKAKFSFPSIKEGSVIELKYTIISDFFFNFQEWQFQYMIPVAYSEYNALIPEFFNYHKNLKGYDMVNIKQSNTNRNEIFMYEWESLPQKGGKVVKGESQLPSNSTLWEWTAHTIPAFVEEAEVTTYRDYVSILDFELRSIKYPNSPIKPYTNTWEEITKKLIESESFGKQLKVNKKVKEQSDIICSGLETKSEKLLAVYSHIQNKYKWNSTNRLYLSKKLSKIIEQKSGNSSDINLLFMNMLRSQNINANPIILSTRNNGKIFPNHPTISAFNYVIVEVKIDEDVYYLDATTDIIPLGLLPKRCLNGYGRKILDNNSQEFKLKASGKYSTSILYSVKFSNGKKISADVNRSYKAYGAIYNRNIIINSGGVEDYIKKTFESIGSENITDYKVENFDDIYKPLKESYKITTSDNITFAGNMIYLSPLLDEAITENPFKLEERKYPVDFAYPISKKIIMQYTIPEDYEIAELPKSLNMALPGKAANYQFQVSQIGNMMQVISIFKINQTVFQYDTYKSLQNFYNLVIEKQNEKIVLKKKD